MKNENRNWFKSAKAKVAIIAILVSVISAFIQFSFLPKAGKTKPNEYTRFLNETVSTQHEIDLLRLDLYRSVDVLEAINISGKKKLPSDYNYQASIYVEYVKILTNRMVQLMETSRYLHSSMTGMKEFLEEHGEPTISNSNDVARVLKAIEQASGVKLKLTEFNSKLANKVKIDALLSTEKTKNVSNDNSVVMSGSYVIRLPMTKIPSFDEAYDSAVELTKASGSLLQNYSALLKTYNNEVSNQDNLKKIILFILTIIGFTLSLFAVIIEDRSDAKENYNGTNNSSKSGADNVDGTVQFDASEKNIDEALTKKSSNQNLISRSKSCD